MGVWEGTIFSHDMAANWTDYLAEDGSVAEVAELLTEVAELSADRYLEDERALESLAAAELVAAALGRPVVSSRYNERSLAWAARNPELAELRSVAVKAIERVQTPKSELWLEVNADTESLNEWTAGVADLLQRLQAPA